MNPGIYVFNWTVHRPGGASFSTVTVTTSSSSSWSVSTKYPTNFTGSSANLVGRYSVNVTETGPMLVPNAASGSFIIGLTDALTYQRTYPVQIQAGGYLPTDIVTINITRTGNTTPTLSTSKTADNNGLVTYSWQTTPSTNTGNFTLTMAGTSTPAKNPIDTQQFIIYPTNITATAFSTNRVSLQRSQSIDFLFNASYLSGLVFSQGSANIRLTEPSGAATHFTLASYNSTLGRFWARYAVPLSSRAGTWNASIDANSLRDAYGNGGPLQASVINFNVQPAVLTLAVVTSGATFSIGDAMPIQVAILTPAGASFSQGTVNATLTFSGRRVTAPIALTYDQTRTEWIGSYKIQPSDPSGTWLVTVSASDSYGNTGQTSVINTVSVPSPTPVYETWNFALLVLLGVGLGFITLIFHKRGSTHREVKLDIQAIKTQADKVKSDDFLQSIQEQVRKRKEKMGLEKPGHD